MNGRKTLHNYLHIHEFIIGVSSVKKEYTTTRKTPIVEQTGWITYCKQRRRHAMGNLGASQSEGGSKDLLKELALVGSF